MNCRKARHLLNEKSDVLNLELVRHLKSCRSCSREASAAGLLEKILRQARETDNLNQTPFETFRAKIETARNSEPKESSIMATIKSQLGRRPKIAIGVGLAIFVFLFVTFVPFPYTKTTGYNVVFNGVSPAVVEQATGLASAFAAVGYENVGLMLTDKGATLVNLPSRQAAREVATVFATATRVTSAAEIVEMTQRVSGSLYAQALEQQRRIEINAEGKTDAEIQADIIQKLAEAGFPGSNVTVTTSPEGQRQINVGMNWQDSGRVGEETVQLNVDGDSGNIGIALPIKIEVDTKGKTDAEIESEIRAKLAEQGIENPEVIIVTEPDGKKKVEVKAEKQEIR